MNWQLKVLPRAEEFLWGCPPRVQRLMTDIAESVALSGPTRFSGGGYWEAMRGTMRGWFEIRCTGPGREQFRLFCLLESEARRWRRESAANPPAIVVVAGLRKPHRTVFSERDYAGVRVVGETYLRQLRQDCGEH